MNENRPSPIAGVWYPSDAQLLKAEIQYYLEKTIYEPLPGELRALMVPHAGYRYSGKTAAYAYQYLQQKTLETIYLFSPYHEYHAADFLTPGYPAYETPLGKVTIDESVVASIQQDLIQATGQSIQPVLRDREHSLEIQLPFLQCVLTQPFKIVPIMVRSRNPSHCKELGKIVSAHFNPANSILIASTDLSHFYPENIAHQLDSAILKAVLENQPAAILTAEEQKSGFACGAGALTCVMWANHYLGVNHSKVLYYTTSAETTHDTQSVVGYAAAAFCQP